MIDVDTSTLPEAPGLDDTKSITTAGMMLNGFLGIKDWKTLGKDTTSFLNILVKLATALKDPVTRTRLLKQINDVMVLTQNTEGFKGLDNGRKLALLNKNLQTRISSMRGA